MQPGLQLVSRMESHPGLECLYLSIWTSSYRPLSWKLRCRASLYLRSHTVLPCWSSLWFTDAWRQDLTGLSNQCRSKGEKLGGIELSTKGVWEHVLKKFWNLSLQMLFQMLFVIYAYTYTVSARQCRLKKVQHLQRQLQNDKNDCLKQVSYLSKTQSQVLLRYFTVWVAKADFIVMSFYELPEQVLAPLVVPHKQIADLNQVNTIRWQQW